LFLDGEKLFNIAFSEEFAEAATKLSLDEATQTKVKARAIELFDSLSGKNSTDLCTFEIGVLVAFKA